MKHSYSNLKKTVQRLLPTLILLLVSTVLTACSSQLQTEPPSPSLNSQSPAEPTASPIPTLPPLDGTTLLFEEGKYMRDEYCARIFGYQKTTYGALTIGIADNFIEPQDSQELALKVINRYIDLSTNSPAPMSQSLTVFIIADPNIGECISRDNFVFVAPNYLDSKSFNEALLGAGTGIGEYWIQAGLTSLALGEQTDLDVLKTWYQNTDDLDMVGLFYARFHEDWATEEEIQIARMSATSLVQYALEVENIQADKLLEEVNNDLRTRWLESFGVQRTVTYPYDGHFAGFYYFQNNDCALLVQAERMGFCLNSPTEKEYLDEISELEFYIDHIYYDRKVLADFIMSEVPSIAQLLDIKDVAEHLIPVGHIHVESNANNENTLILHEILHSLNLHVLFTKAPVWVNEGFVHLLSNNLSIYQMIKKQCVFEELSENPDDIETGLSNCYSLDFEQFEAAKNWYLAQGGQMDTEDSVDPSFYTDAVAFATLYRVASDGFRAVPIGEVYEANLPNFDIEGQIGLELNATQAASFLSWLSDSYSIDRVLNVYINNAEDGLLDGKTYPELKAEWHAYLVSKGPGIEIPGKP